jgi:hypothetical protein
VRESLVGPDASALVAAVMAVPAIIHPRLRAVGVMEFTWIIEIFV